MPKPTTEPKLTTRTREYICEATLGAIQSAVEGANYCAEKVSRAKPKEGLNLLDEIVAECEAAIGLARLAKKQMAELA